MYRIIIGEFVLILAEASREPHIISNQIPCDHNARTCHFPVDLQERNKESQGVYTATCRMEVKFDHARCIKDL